MALGPSDESSGRLQDDDLIEILDMTATPRTTEINGTTKRRRQTAKKRNPMGIAIRKGACLPQERSLPRSFVSNVVTIRHHFNGIRISRRRTSRISAALYLPNPIASQNLEQLHT